MRKTGVLVPLLVLAAGAAVAQEPAKNAPSKADIAARAESILSRMTAEQKIDYIGGTEGFYIRAMPELGVPAIKMSDGPMGVRNYGPVTAFPGGILLAASWDTALANRVGTMMGQDARARGVHIILGPGMNIHRAPMNGRNFEYLGEDPFLAGRIAVGAIRGIQGQGVIATAKHFAANNQEWNRHGISSDMDERTLREIYLPAFEAAVKEGHVAALMNSYNLLNGTHATQHDHLNNQVTKGDWKFDGIIMSDWDATYDGVAAASGGLDLEMPSGKFMNRETLQTVLDTHRLPNGEIWPLPILLQVNAKDIVKFAIGDRVALIDDQRSVHALLDVSDIYQYDLENLAARIYGTTSREHPGVAGLVDRDNCFVSGDVTLVRPLNSSLRHYMLTPAQTRFIFTRMGWSQVVGHNCQTPAHRGHEFIQLQALERSARLRASWRARNAARTSGLPVTRPESRRAASQNGTSTNRRIGSTPTKRTIAKRNA